MDDNKWPFIPDQISNDEPRLKGTGIISNDELKGLQTIIFAKTKKPNAILEFHRDETGTVTFHRTDSLFSEAALLGSCEVFRLCTNRQFCCGIDEAVSRLFVGLARGDLVPTLTERLRSFLPELPCGATWSPPVLDVANGRDYLHYECPLFGYRETVHPVFFGDRVIAAFFVGQLPLNSVEGKARRIWEAFRPHLPQLLKDLGNECSREIGRYWEASWVTPVKVLGLLRNTAEDCAMDDEAYDGLLGQIVEQIATMEELLVKKANERREAFALSRMQESVLQLQAIIPSSFSPESMDSPLQDFWERLDDILAGIVDSFGYRYLAVFAVEDPFDRRSSVDLVSYATSDEGHFPRSSVSVSLPTGGVPEDAPLRVNSLTDASAMEQLLPASWPDRDNQDERSALTCFMPFHKLTPLLVMCGHRPGEGPNTYQSVLHGLGTISSTIVTVLASVLESIQESRTRTSFQVLGHEIRQQTQGMRHLIERYLTPDRAHETLTLPHEKLSQVGKNAIAFIDHVSFLFGNAGQLADILWGPITLDKETFLPYGTLVHKWKDFYKDELASKGRAMPLERAATGSRERPPLHADRRRIEQMLYNLIGNGIKYSYFGTNVWVDCGVSNHDDRPLFINGHYFLSVTDYGMEMPSDEEGERLYRVFQRGKLAEGRGHEGTGIGIALGRAIAQAHGGDLRHRTRKTSDFCVPMIGPFLDYVREGKLRPPNNLIQRVENEHNRLAEEGILRRVVSPELRRGKGVFDECFYPGRSLCLELITQPTFEVTFVASLPSWLPK